MLRLDRCFLCMNRVLLYDRAVFVCSSHLLWTPVYTLRYILAHQPGHTGVRSTKYCCRDFFVIVPHFPCAVHVYEIPRRCLSRGGSDRSFPSSTFVEFPILPNSYGFPPLEILQGENPVHRDPNSHPRCRCGIEGPTELRGDRLDVYGYL